MLHAAFGVFGGIEFLGNANLQFLFGVKATIFVTYVLGLLVFIFLWCRADAKFRKIRIRVRIAALIAVLFPVGVPFYFLRTYALGRAIAHIGLSVVFVASCVAAMSLTTRFVYRPLSYFAIAT